MGGCTSTGGAKSPWRASGWNCKEGESADKKSREEEIQHSKVWTENYTSLARCPNESTQLELLGQFNRSLKRLASVTEAYRDSVAHLSQSMGGLARDLHSAAAVTNDPLIVRSGEATFKAVLSLSVAQDTQSPLASLTQRVQETILQPIQDVLKSHELLHSKLVQRQRLTAVSSGGDTFVEQQTLQDRVQANAGSSQCVHFERDSRHLEQEVQEYLQTELQRRADLVSTFTEQLHQAQYTFAAVASKSLMSVLPNEVEFRPLSEMMPGHLEAWVEVEILDFLQEVDSPVVHSNSAAELSEAFIERLHKKKEHLVEAVARFNAMDRTDQVSWLKCPGGWRTGKLDKLRAFPSTQEPVMCDRGMNSVIEQGSSDGQDRLEVAAFSDGARSQDEKKQNRETACVPVIEDRKISLAAVRREAECRDTGETIARMPTTLILLQEYKQKAETLLSKHFNAVAEMKPARKCKEHPFDGEWLYKNFYYTIKKSVITANLVPLEVHQADPSGRPALCVMHAKSQATHYGLLTHNSQAIIWKHSSSPAQCWVRVNSNSDKVSKGKRQKRSRQSSGRSSSRVASSTGQVKDAPALLSTMMDSFDKFDETMAGIRTRVETFLGDLRKLNHDMWKVSEALEMCATSLAAGCQLKKSTQKLSAAIRSIIDLDDIYSVASKSKRDAEHNLLDPLVQHMENGERLRADVAARSKAYNKLSHKLKSRAPVDISQETADCLAHDRRIFEWLWVIQEYRNDMIDSLIGTTAAIQTEYFVSASQALTINLELPARLENKETERVIGNIDKGLNHLVTVPPYWKVKFSDHGESPQSLEKCDHAWISGMQALVDRTWLNKRTCDRRGGPAVPMIEVVKVSRNENLVLWTKYFWRRQHMEVLAKVTSGYTKVRTSTDLPGEGLGDQILQPTSETICDPVQIAQLMAEVNECYLFHGTTPTNARVICANGFDLKLAGSHRGSMYGLAMYFAESCSKADEYADDKVCNDGDDGDLHTMLLCRVACGQVLQTSKPQPNVDELLAAVRGRKTHNTVLGDRTQSPGTYREFVIYEEVQAYPEYVIYYRRRPC